MSSSGPVPVASGAEFTGNLCLFYNVSVSFQGFLCGLVDPHSCDMGLDDWTGLWEFGELTKASSDTTQGSLTGMWTDE